MGKIKDFFGDFIFRARILPACVAIIPFIMYGLFKNIVDKSLFDCTLYSIIIIATLSLFAYITRNLGKSHEEKLFKNLGAMPTTLLLMFSYEKNKKIDKYTKLRYHTKLNNRVPDLKLPLSLEEEKKCLDSIDVYNSSIVWLRNYANKNPEKYPLVRQTLIQYNFWRNLYGIKNISIFLYFLVAIREIVLMENFNIKNVFYKPYPEYMSLIILCFSIVLMIFFVTNKVVEKRAFEYATTLLEVCEDL